MSYLRSVFGILRRCLSQALTGTNNYRHEVDHLLKERDEEIEHLDRRREMLLRRRELRTRLHNRGHGESRPR